MFSNFLKAVDSTVKKTLSKTDSSPKPISIPRKSLDDATVVSNGTSNSADETDISERESMDVASERAESTSPETAQSERRTSSIGDILSLGLRRRSSFEIKLPTSFSKYRSPRENEEGRGLVALRSELWTEIADNHKQTTTQAVAIREKSTSACLELKQRKEQCLRLERELASLESTAKNVRQISIDIDHIFNKLGAVEKLLEQVMVMDVSIQHLKWENRLEANMRNHASSEARRLVAKKAQTRASHMTKGLREDMTRLFRTASVEKTDTSRPFDSDGKTQEPEGNREGVSVDKVSVDKADMKEENLTRSAVIIDENEEDNFDEDELEEEDFDPSTLYNE